MSTESERTLPSESNLQSQNLYHFQRFRGYTSSEDENASEASLLQKQTCSDASLLQRQKYSDVLATPIASG
ncbi:hypothetical protein L195_g007963 [Trifolium pratense]|uniref:Uncharacterized protein n=1 Tax=Trifolium pratense TaxID=57577 RepID=A0A2K3P7V7_TRIPR|nr:hypothetical protein L195_g007963 [Trifolium pratense]